MSSRSLNKVILIGNLTRDPELRYTPQGTPVCSFGLATNRSWVDSGGQKQEATEFHRIVAWQKLAELCSQLLFKGRKAYLEGRLQTRNWTGQDGQERTTTEVVIDNMIVLDNKQKDQGSSSDGEFVPVSSGASSQKTDDQKQAVKADDSAKAQKPADDKKKEEKPVAKVAKEPEAKNEEVSAEDIPF